MEQSKTWRKLNFRRTNISYKYHPFQFPIINELLNNREHRIISNIDDYSMTVILLSIHVILADRVIRVGEKEILLQKLIEKFPRITPSDLNYLLKMYFFQFNNGDDAYIFKYSLEVLPGYINSEIRDKAVKNNLCYFLCEVAMADNEFSKAEKHVLLKICRGLGLTDMDIARLFAYFEGRITDINFSTRHRWEKQIKETKKRAKTKRTRQKPTKVRFNYSLYKYHSALIILGVTKNTSVDLIKRAYKNLAKQYHPDRFVNIPAMEKQKSTEMFIKIQNAYELVKKIKRFT